MGEIEDEPTARRLRAIKLAQELDNVAEACRRTGLDRTSFYKWKRRYEALGEDGLVDRPSRHHYHPHSASDVVVSRIADMAIKHPLWGCNRIERQLAADGHVLSSTSIQKILHKAGLATQRDRWRVLDQPFNGPLPFSAEQMRFLRQLNPCWRDRGAAGAYPGEFLVNGAFLLTSRDRKRIFVHCAVDVLTSVARAHAWYFRETDRASACLEDLCKYFSTPPWSSRYQDVHDVRFRELVESAYQMDGVEAQALTCYHAAKDRCFRTLPQNRP